MAKIRDYAFTEGTVALVSVAPDMPAHQTNDLLIIFANADAVGFGTAPTGWTQMYSADAGTHGYAIYWKIATSSSEAPTVNLVSLETHAITVVAIQDVNTTTPINTNAIRTANDLTNPFAGIGVTTTSNNCLVFSFISSDSGIGPTCAPPWTNLVNGDAGANSGGLAYTVKKTAGVVSAPDWWGYINDDTVSITIAVNDNGSLTTLPPYIQQDTVNGVFLESGAFAATNAWGNSYTVTLSLATIGSKTTSGDAASLVADQGLNPYWPVANCTPAKSTDGSTVGGPQVDFGTAKDLTGGITLFNYFFTTSRDYVDISKTTDSGQVGLLFVTRDASNNYKAWSVGAKETVTTKPDGYNITAIQVDQTTNTRYASSGTQSNTAVASILTLAQGRYGAVSFRWGNLVIVYEQAIAGGTSSNVLNFDDMETLLNTSVGQQRIMLREGSAATFVAPLKFGGTDPIHIAVSLRTLQYRLQSDGAAAGGDYLDWHVDDNFAGFEFDGQAGDTIKFTNCVFVSGSPTYWRFSSDHSASANIDFSGSTIINQSVTLRSSVTLDNLAFVSCPTFTQNGATLTNCEFTNTKVNTGAPADAALISDSSFTKTTGTQHGMEIAGTAANMTLTNVDFTGYASSDGSTGNEAIYVNIGSGSMIITISGGTIPSIRTAGATVTVIANPVSLSIHVQDINTGDAIVGARVWIPVTSTASGRPFNQTINSIIRAGSTATVTFAAAHNLATNDYLQISGAEQPEYNHTFHVTVTGATTLTVTVSGTPPSGSGTMIGTWVIINGVTDGSGDISASYTYADNQPISGRVRSASGVGPYYKTAPISGIVSSTNGLAVTIQMIPDA